MRGLTFAPGRNLLIVTATVALIATAGCSLKKNTATGNNPVAVKTMNVIKRDTPVIYEYTGFVEATREMELRSQVSGQITGKFFKGGDTVTAGQVLYSIDQRTYQANLMNAQAAVANARATLANAELNADRYNKLYEQNAVSRQAADNAMTQLAQSRAAVAAQEALLQNAQVSMSETNVTAPFSGRVDTSSIEAGNFVTAGQTVLTKISNTDPVYVSFSIAENEYLKLAAADGTNSTALDNLSIRLSDGSVYELKGNIAEVNRGINENMGNLTVKAQFPNPNRKLLPGMFAHVQATGGIKKDALLIPQRAIVELMYKKFVYVVDENKKVALKEVTLGPSVGRMVVVEGGLTGSETLVVEGTGKMKNGMEVNPQPMTEEELTTEDKTAVKK
ncbi:MAG: efflux RND transporter periplasmic adaptor subunit [Acidaminococcaceae bacterium]|nr:efflux RND transporter periplasmic adaptor subunit [Acidaminococcaceae bacterium]